MPIFISSREKRLWIYALIVFVAILSNLALGRPLQEMLRDQNVQAVFFLAGMILTGATIIMHGLKVKPSKTEIAIWFGLAAVGIMFVFRLGAPERSHIMEYSVLAIFIHKAFIERFSHKNQVLMPALLALVITVMIGTCDEGLQLYLPNRVFDPNDIIFNSFAAFMAIGGSLLLQWAKQRFRKNK